MPNLGLWREIVGRDGRSGLEIAEDDVAPEGAAARDDGASAIERAAPSIEYQVVVAAELVHVHERHAVLPGHAAQHLLSAPVLSD